MLGSKLKTRQVKSFSALSLQENADDCGGASFISPSTSVSFMCLLFAAVVSWWRITSLFYASSYKGEDDKNWNPWVDFFFKLLNRFCTFCSQRRQTQSLFKDLGCYEQLLFNFRELHLNLKLQKRELAVLLLPWILFSFVIFLCSTLYLWTKRDWRVTASCDGC